MNTTHTACSSAPLHSPLKSHRQKRLETMSQAVETSRDNRESSSSPSVTMFKPISAPVLRSVDPVRVTRLLKERKHYELEIESKQAELPSLKSLSYSASIDRSLLKNLFFICKLDDLAPDANSIKNLSNEVIKNFIEAIFKCKDGDTIDPSAIGKPLIEFEMPMYILDSNARITTYCSELFEKLESVGAGSFRKDNSEKTVTLLISRLKPPALKSKIRRRVEYDESLEKNLKAFIKLLIGEAANCQTYGGEKFEKKLPIDLPPRQSNELKKSRAPDTKSKARNTSPLCCGKSTRTMISVTLSKIVEAVPKKKRTNSSPAFKPTIVTAPSVLLMASIVRQKSLQISFSLRHLVTSIVPLFVLILALLQIWWTIAGCCS